MTQLPGIAGEIEDAIGLELTAKLLRARGGTEVNIPTRPGPNYVTELLGADATQRLIDVMGAGRIVLPCGHMRGRDAERIARRDKAMAMLAAGRSLREVALQCDLHLRTVERYNAERDRTIDQPKLPL
ncbi:hypothetical protein LGQ03_04935 [Loktanella sp. TSTF-M6]|uniref:Homeodomain-like domain-containing protein n=1 Tax=Loktanella gaetbuli TaxID=2881335 RepID=A0ABS8BSX9_9RHOB|nr:hypothetical protein [Loktanella gaetbuli]MCB5198576.1 hypothetical protein [Loktanella gaetbuli]